ncbi:Cytosine deaminase [Sulfobacillus acidophilus DSM 10332]|uniref:Cytosine deaminase n=1 Tax=Sulfobacillus acidophilus (strain ATCC 700253 / DSM 10332 / NAL) TaxID=679936 RepID=G8TUR9_SULAD|nr:Cytosine deaminase [Sulfobacillus acidophilus DSM 10332]
MATPHVPLTLYRARLLNQPDLYRITMDQGKIHTVEPDPSCPPGVLDIQHAPIRETLPAALDVKGRLVIPGMVDAHMHLDKALTLPYAQNPSGTLEGAIQSFGQIRPRLTPEDVVRRFRLMAETVVAHGTTSIRSHLDFTTASTFLPLLQALAAVIDEWHDRLDVQLVVMAPRDNPPEFVDALAAGAARYLTAIGGAPHLASDPNTNLTWITSLAQKWGLGLDLHVDEQLNPAAKTLGWLAHWLTKNTVEHLPVIAGHVVSIGTMPPEEASALIQTVAEVPLGVVTCPATNLYLQGRHDTVNVRRGLTRIREWLAAGVPVAIASDNIQDPFNPFGRGDLLEMALLAGYAAHLGAAEADTLLAMITEIPGQLLGLSPYGVVPGSIADVVVLDAHSALEALQWQSPARWVFKRGRLVASRALVQHWYGMRPETDLFESPHAPL